MPADLLRPPSKDCWTVKVLTEDPTRAKQLLGWNVNYHWAATLFEWELKVQDQRESKYEWNCFLFRRNGREASIPHTLPLGD